MANDNINKFDHGAPLDGADIRDGLRFDRGDTFTVSHANKIVEGVLYNTAEIDKLGDADGKNKGVKERLNDHDKLLADMANKVFDFLYPVGKIIISDEEKYDPNKEVNGMKLPGVWARIENKFLYSVSGALKKSGGYKSLQAHSHPNQLTGGLTFSEATGSFRYAHWTENTLVVDGTIFTSADSGIEDKFTGTGRNDRNSATINFKYTPKYSSSLAVENAVFPKESVDSAKDNATDGNMPPYYTVHAWRRDK